MGATLPRFEGVTSRVLAESERPYPTAAVTVPIVIEAKRWRDSESLNAFLAASSREVLQLVHAHGAVLLRGFEITTERAFEAAMESIRGLRPMSGYFMKEPGRDAVKGTRHTFYTNRYFKTGGGFSSVGNFHSENYYSTDVPAFQMFWCAKPPWLGGETALVHMPSVYDELDANCRARLEADPVRPVGAYKISDVCERYGISERAAEDFFDGAGLPTVVDGGIKFVVVHKASICEHPHNDKRRALIAHLSLELPALDAMLHELFAPSYSGRRWTLHRFAWKRDGVAAALGVLETIPMIVDDPAILLVNVPYLARSVWSKVTGKPASLLPGDEGPARLRLHDRLKPDEVEALARALRKYCSLFSWRRGDILISDNLQMLHTGMPGAGPRELRVMLCNPIAMTKQAVDPVVGEDATVEFYESIDTRIRRFADACHAPA